MMNNNYSNILETFGRIVYSHKTHEKAADRLNRRIKNVKLLQVILLSLTSAGVFSSFTDILDPVIKNHPNFNLFFNLALLVVSLVATGFSVYDLSSSLKDDLEKHKTASIQLLNMREQFQMLITDFKDNILNEVELVERRNFLMEKLIEIYKNSPSTTSTDYKKASEALKNKEEFTFNEGEVEKFLPVKMRSNK